MILSLLMICCKVIGLILNKKTPNPCEIWGKPMKQICTSTLSTHFDTNIFIF